LIIIRAIGWNISWIIIRLPVIVVIISVVRIIILIRSIITRTCRKRKCRTVLSTIASRRNCPEIVCLPTRKVGKVSVDTSARVDTGFVCRIVQAVVASTILKPSIANCVIVVVIRIGV
jgi:hypothetical protein